MANQQTVQSSRNPIASDVARYLLEKKGTLTGFQLQKLLYYCQAWSLVVEDKPLFMEEIRAYKHGPTVPSVSMQHQGKYYVHPSDIVGDSSMLSEADTAFIDTILLAYESLTGDQLEQLTHEEDPWLSSYNQCTSVDSSAVITKDSMRAYYSQLLTDSDEVQRRHHVPRFNHPKNIFVSASDFDWLKNYLDQEA